MMDFPRATTMFSILKKNHSLSEDVEKSKVPEKLKQSTTFLDERTEAVGNNCIVENPNLMPLPQTF